MSKLFEEAVAEARRLPDAEQDELAAALFAHLADPTGPFGLTDAQTKMVEARMADLREGRARLATEEEVEAVWRRCGQ